MSGSSEVLLSCEGLQAGYGSSQVLFDVSLKVHTGEVVGLLGRNGMGKSSTIKCLIGALVPKHGDVRFGGESVKGLRMDVIARLGVAIVPEGRQCFPNLSVREHLCAFAENRAGLDNPWTLKDLYELFPRLAERSDNMGDQLSGGEQQMLAIARALSTNPKLLILDEATEGLAPLIREEIWRCLSRLKARGQTILVVDKYIERLIQIADRHIILERGRVAWTGSSNALDADRSLWQRYMGV